MNYKTAKETADKYLNKLKPHCRRIEIAGSIRREKSEVKDIEIVCIPKSVKVQKDMFNEEEIRNKKFTEYVNSFNRTKGSAAGKYTQLILPEGINLDLFMANENNFGLILMISTGSAAFSKRMVTEIRSKGFRCEGGYLYNSSNEIIPVKEEKDFFKITGQEYLEPFFRGW